MFNIDRLRVSALLKERNKKITEFIKIFEPKVESIKEKYQKIVSENKNNLININTWSEKLKLKTSDNEIDFTSFLQSINALQQQITATKKQFNNDINNIVQYLEKQPYHIKKVLKEIYDEKFLVLKHELESQEKYIKGKKNEMQLFKSGIFWTNQAYKNKNKPGLANIFVNKLSSTTDNKNNFSNFIDDTTEIINSQEKPEYTAMVNKHKTQTFKFHEKISNLKNQIIPTISELDENNDSVQIEQENNFNILEQEIKNLIVKIKENFSKEKTMKMIPTHVKQTKKSANKRFKKQQKEMQNNNNEEFNNLISVINNDITDKDVIEMHYGKNHICLIL